MPVVFRLFAGAKPLEEISVPRGTPVYISASENHKLLSSVAFMQDLVEPWTVLGEP